ncbi:MAG: hypothetical protein ACK5UZ_04335, partial [Pseudanabaena sp.]
TSLLLVLISSSTSEPHPHNQKVIKDDKPPYYLMVLDFLLLPTQPLKTAPFQTFQYAITAQPEPIVQDLT